MELSNLRPAEGSKHSDNFRRGRGHGSGNGKTAGKGHKGQLARSGHKKPGFEGGQMPLYRRLPKRGFTNRNSKEIIAINVDVLNRFEDGAEVTVDSLLASGAISKIGDGVKILGNGELTKKLNVKVNAGIFHIPFCHAYVFHHVLIFSHSDMRIILSSPLQETVALHTRSAFVFSLPADPGYGLQKAGTVYKDAADFQKALL